MLIYLIRQKVLSCVGLTAVALMTWSLSANTINISVQDSPRAFLINTDVCMYGASNASALKDYTLQLVKKQFFNDKLYIEEQLQKKYGLENSRAEQLVIGSAFKSKDINLQLDIKKIGNELCSKGKNVVPIDTDESIQSLIPFSPPSEYHWIATDAEHSSKAKNILAQYNWPVLETWINSATTKVTTVNEDNISKHYYLFNTDKYLALLNERNKTVYVEANDKYKNAIYQYLSDNDFDIKSTSDLAYWQLKFNILQNPDNVLVNLEIKSDAETMNLESNAIPFALKANSSNVQDHAQLNKLIKVHLTMMELSHQLRFKAN